MRFNHQSTINDIIRITLIVFLALALVSCSSIYSKPALSLDAGFVSGDTVVKNVDGVLSLYSTEESAALVKYSIDLVVGETKGGIAYRSFISGYGWQSWLPSGETSGTVSNENTINAVQIMLTGHIANYYDISYRVNLQSSGWQDWVSNGTVSGMTEEPIVGMEIKLEAKQGEIKDASWTLTEYGDDDGRQSEFYTLTNNDDGTLIVIDGGWDANTEQVRSIINLYGGEVDYWFITHYDADHVSAFNNIYADPQGITIGTVYTTPLDYDLYCSYAEERWWDTPEVYKLFLDQTEGDDSIVYLNRDDCFDIAGLNVYVFNSFDQIVVDTGNPDVANYGSLMFKITGEKNSFLVCGDVYGSLWNTLSAMYGNKLAADYVQLGHHGNNHVSPDAWAVVNAKVAFFDGPAWVTQSDNYTAKALMQWYQNNGIKTYEFSTAPNSVGFD